MPFFWFCHDVKRQYRRLVQKNKWSPTRVSTLSNLVIMSKGHWLTMKVLQGSGSIGDQLITNFRFADDIIVNAKEEEDVEILADRLDTITARYKTGIVPENMGQVMRTCVLCHMRTKRCSLICTFVVRCSDSVICILAISKVSRF